MTPPDQNSPADSTTPVVELPVLDNLEPANNGWWHRIGGGSLTVSIIIHAVVILVAILVVFSYSTTKEEPVDFLPGGGGGGKGSEAKVAQKKRAASMSAPKTRTVSISANADVSLPDIATSMSDFSALTQATPMGGGMGGGEGGLKGKGKGGLMGDGFGSGMGPGRGAGFIAMPLFGQKIDARRMAVVLDMSGSMYPFLPVVIKEVDKVAPGSTVILHYGCGMNDTEVRKPEVNETKEKNFETDRIITSLDESRALPQAERDSLMELVKKRPKTYYVPSTGVGTTWIALTDSQLKDADAIYWFADFADALSMERLEDVSRKLRARKQKLYIHPSNPKWLVGGDPLAVNVAKVEKEIVKPTGGKVIKAEVKKDVPVKEDKKPPAKPAA
jgi:hypothetical protein